MASPARVNGCSHTRRKHNTAVIKPRQRAMGRKASAQTSARLEAKHHHHHHHAIRIRIRTTQPWNIEMAFQNVAEPRPQIRLSPRAPGRRRLPTTARWEEDPSQSAATCPYSSVYTPASRYAFQCGTSNGRGQFQLCRSPK